MVGNEKPRDDAHADRTAPITVTVIDDHPAIIAAVRHWYATATAPIHVVASGDTAKAAWLPPGDRADIVILDLQLAEGMAYSALRQLVDAGRHVIVYTMRNDQHTALTCLDIGAFTFLSKSKGEEHLVPATVAAAEGRPYTPPELAGVLGTNTRSDRPQMSQRELDVLLE